MASTLTDFTSKTSDKVRAPTGDLSSTQIQSNLSQAVRIYSLLKPREIAKDVSGNGGYEYTLPAEWEEGFSSLRQVEYPIGSQDPVYVPLEKILEYRTPTAMKLRFTDTSPSQDFRLTFTVRHTLTGSVNTIPECDFDAICSAAASLCCHDLARKYGQSGESIIGADAVDRRGKSDIFASRAKELWKEFREQVIGGDAEALISPTVMMKEFDTLFGWGEDYLTHPADYR